MTRQSAKSAQANPTQANPTQANPTQADPTQPRPRDTAGNELDGWGLPIAGPLRAARLAELEKPDPNVEPEAWASAVAGSVTQPVAPDQKENADG